MILAAAARIGRQEERAARALSHSAPVMPRTSPAPTWRARSPRGKTSGKREPREGTRRRSRADPLDPEKKLSRFGEGHRGEGIEIEHAARHRTAQVEEMGLLPGHPDLTERRLARTGNGLGVTAPRQPVKSAVHRRPRFEGDLLFLISQTSVAKPAGRDQNRTPCNSTTAASADPRRRAGSTASWNVVPSRRVTIGRNREIGTGPKLRESAAARGCPRSPRPGSPGAVAIDSFAGRCAETLDEPEVPFARDEGATTLATSAGLEAVATNSSPGDQRWGIVFGHLEPLHENRPQGMVG